VFFYYTKCVSTREATHLNNFTFSIKKTLFISVEVK
jgi:hypothetical protein